MGLWCTYFFSTSPEVAVFHSHIRLFQTPSSLPPTAILIGPFKCFAFRILCAMWPARVNVNGSICIVTISRKVNTVIDVFFVFIPIAPRFRTLIFTWSKYTKIKNLLHIMILILWCNRFKLIQCTCFLNIFDFSSKHRITGNFSLYLSIWKTAS